MRFFALVTILLPFLVSLVHAQVAPVSVVAVGAAQDEKDRVAFGQVEGFSSLPKSARAVMQEIEALLKNDFAFYRHRLEGVELSTPVTAPQWEAWSGFGYTHVVALKVNAKGAGVELTGEIWGVAGRRSVGKATITATSSQARSEGHRLADAMFRLITGRNSIFLKKIVFVSDRASFGRDTRKDLYSMDFDGHQVERLTHYNSTVISPAISPDNRRIIFSLVEEHAARHGHKTVLTKNIDLKELDLATKKTHTVSGLPGVNSGAVYSHDGKSIYFTLTTSGNADIYEMSLAGGRPRRITQSQAEDVDPTITSDGHLMSFLSNRSGRAHIYITDPRGTEKDVRRISFVGQFNASPRFSPDGKEIVFVSWVDNAFDLYRVDGQGGNLVRLTKDSGSNEEPWWSPDGEFIIFTSQKVINRHQALQDIMIMNREGEILGQLTQGFGRCFSPRWSN